MEIKRLFWSVLAMIFATITAVGVKTALPEPHWLSVTLAMGAWIVIYVIVILVGGWIHASSILEDVFRGER